jgi:hypothetical protein
MFACAPLASFEFSHSLMSFLLQHASQGSMNVSALQAVVIEAWEAAATMEAACVTVVLDANNFTQEGAAT